MSRVNIEVNGIIVGVKQGSTVLQACAAVGVEIPRFCYHESLLVAGNCRMCLVEIAGSPKPQAACARPVTRGPGGSLMKVVTDSPLVKKAREGMMEFRLANHPLDCPICDQGGECDLQDQSMIYGSDRSRMYDAKRGVEDKDLGPLVKTVMTRCIHCTRCIRFASEVAGVADRGTTARGRSTEVGTYIEKMFNSELSGNLVDLCPVGALTSKPYAFKARPLELETVETVDATDGFGASIKVQSRGNEVMRIMPINNSERNGELLGDKSRFSVDGLQVQRVRSSYVIKGDKKTLTAVDTNVALSYAKDLITKGKKLITIVSSEVSNELVKATRKLSSLVSNVSHYGRNLPVEYSTPLVFNNSMDDVVEADVVVRVGVDVRKESPLLNAKLRYSFLRGKSEFYSVGLSSNRTYPVEIVGLTPHSLKAKDGKVSKRVKKLQSSKTPMVIVGSGIYQRNDFAVIQKMLNELVKGVKVKEGLTIINYLSTRPNLVGRINYNREAFKGFKALGDRTNTTVMLVGVSKGELNELGYNLPKGKVGSLIVVSSHGDNRVGSADVVLPIATYVEVSNTLTNFRGTEQVTSKVVSTAFGEHTANVNYNHVELLARSLGAPSHSDQEMKGYNVTSKVKVDSKNLLPTIMLPTIYDYYTEGNSASRVSKTMAQCSKTFAVGNFNKA